MSKTPLASIWRKYFENQSPEPRKLLVTALSLVNQKEYALDIGAGALFDSQYLLDQGFEHVTAIDPDQASYEYAQEIQDRRFTFIHTKVEEIMLAPDSYDLINASKSLPFIALEVFNPTFTMIAESLKSGGILVVNFFGPRFRAPDNSVSRLTHTRKEVEVLLQDFEILTGDFDQEKDGTVIDLLIGEPVTTHWHVHHIVAQKK